MNILPSHEIISSTNWTYSNCITKFDIRSAKVAPVYLAIIQKEDEQEKKELWPGPKGSVHMRYPLGEKIANDGIDKLSERESGKGFKKNPNM